MNAPAEFQSAADDHDVAITRREYDDAVLVAIDLGSGETSIDVVGDQAIVVAGDRQYEFVVPEAATDVSVNNGVLLLRQ